MKVNIGKVVLVGAASIVSMMIGIYIGASQIVYRFKSLDDSTNIVNISSTVKILREIRVGEYSAATEHLEKKLDLYLSFVTQNPNYNKDNKIVDIIKDAKLYRESYPSHIVDKNFVNEINKAFSFKNISTSK